MNNPTHPVVPEEVMSLLDGELSGTRSLLVSAHIEECFACRELRDSLGNTSRALSRWVLPASAAGARVENPLSSSAAVASFKKPSGLGLPLSFSRLRPWAAALGFAVLVVLAVSVGTQRRVGERAHTVAARLEETPWEGRGTARQTREGGFDQSEGGSLGKFEGPQAQAKDIREVTKNRAQSGPMIARTASLSIVVKDFDAARASLDALLVRHDGYAASLNVGTPEAAARTLQASLRIPAPQLGAALGELKSLGRVEGEAQNGEEVTEQHADLVARIKNDHETELRLQHILGTRTGKVKDVLEVEQEIARVRGEIEQMEAEQKTLEHRVEFATIDLRLAEEYKAQLNTPAPSVWIALHNSGISGFRHAFATLLALVLFLAESGPSLLLWLALLGIPVWRLWRRYRRARSLATLPGV